MSTFINSTAGAVLVRNEKGELVMQKVKVQRYVTGKAPEYAAQAESDDDDDILARDAGRRGRFDGAKQEYVNELGREGSDEESERGHDQSAEAKAERKPVSESEDEDDLDPRLRRIRETKRSTNDESEQAVSKRQRLERHVQIDSEDERADERAQDVDEDAEGRHERARKLRDTETRTGELEHTDVRRIANANARRDASESQSEESEQEEEEEEDESESETEDGRPRLFKPVFVRRKDRVTIREHERDAERKRREAEAEAQKRLQERRNDTLRVIEETNRAEVEERRAAASAVHLVTASGSLVPATMEISSASAKEDDEVRDRLAALDTDSENEQDENAAERAYEEWKLRELRRMKRDREERERWQRERDEVERWHRMTEEQREEELRRNPKLVTNAQPKGKYNFLQKYFHRGVFYLDEEQELFKRDFTQQTLDDQIDRTKLPQVMQVKNFGRAGRTKWTHLVGEDTTGDVRNQLGNGTYAAKFHSSHAGGMKQVFDRPAAKKNH